MAGRGRNRYTHLHVDDAARLLIAVARRGWSGVAPVGDDMPTDWRQFFAVLAAHYPRFRTLYLPGWLARLGTELLRPLNALRRRPSLYTPDTVIGWNLELAVRPGVLWQELGLKPAYPTIHEGLPAALDDAWPSAGATRCRTRRATERRPADPVRRSAGGGPTPPPPMTDEGDPGPR